LFALGLEVSEVAVVFLAEQVGKVVVVEDRGHSKRCRLRTLAYYGRVGRVCESICRAGTGRLRCAALASGTVASCNGLRPAKFAEEFGRALLAWVFEDLLGWAGFEDAAFFEDVDLMGGAAGEVHGVGDDDHGLAGLCQIG
jgi:hypothetical protein